MALNRSRFTRGRFCARFCSAGLAQTSHATGIGLARLSRRGEACYCFGYFVHLRVGAARLSAADRLNMPEKAKEKIKKIHKVATCCFCLIIFFARSASGAILDRSSPNLV